MSNFQLNINLLLGYSEGGSTSSSYASSEGDGGEESDDY